MSAIQSREREVGGPSGATTSVAVLGTSLALGDALDGIFAFFFQNGATWLARADDHLAAAALQLAVAAARFAAHAAVGNQC